MNIDFAITYCCENLQEAVVERDLWFQIQYDPITSIDTRCVLTDEDDSFALLKCPFCKTDMTDIVDIAMEGMDQQPL